AQNAFRAMPNGGTLSIQVRRSIRRFQSRAIPRETLERLLVATIQAPSAKNSQPWRLVVLEGEENAKLAAMMLQEATRLKALAEDIGSLEWTARAMAPAPVTVVWLNTAPPKEVPQEFYDDWRWVMLQSTGGAIQTMLLAATALGLGSLWICDVLYVTDEVKAWLGRPGDDLVACVTLGYADEAPGPRPRTPWRQVTAWRGVGEQDSV
ncbi:MAG: nitroreductase family protein, partial [Chloroflexota bacterium]